MKTIFKSFRGNNVQKTILRSVAVLTSFVLISFTVSAQDFWKKLLTNSSFNEIALALVENPKPTEKPILPANTFNYNLVEPEFESPLELESWMFTEKKAEIYSIGLTIETEPEITLENWMLDEKRFEPQMENDSPLELESWMTSESLWNV